MKQKTEWKLISLLLAFAMVISLAGSVSAEEGTMSEIIKDPISAALTEEHAKAMNELKKVARAKYGENKKITDAMGEGFVTWTNNLKEKKYAQLTDVEKELVESYFLDIKEERIKQLSTLFDQIWFNAPFIRTVENQAATGGKAYAYFFRVRSGHGNELTTVLDHPEMNDPAIDETFSKTLRKMWVQFAENGDPSLSADISPDGKSHEWPLYNLEDKQIMVFDEFNIHPEKESEMKLVDRDRTYFLTKYYLF